MAAAGPELTTPRLRLRRWTDADRAPFAELNADPRVMEHLSGLLSPADSDAFIARMEAEFDARGYGLWAVEVRGDASFAGFVGLHLQSFEAHFTPASKSAGAWHTTRGDTATPPRRPARRSTSPSAPRA